MVLVAGLLASCTTEQGIEVPTLLEPVGAQLETVAVSRGNVDVTSVYDGQVIPNTEVFSFDMDGRVTEVHAYLGNKVSEGDVLIEIENIDQDRIEALEEEKENLSLSFEHELTILNLQLKKSEVELSRLKANGASTDEISRQQLNVERATLNRTQATARYDQRVEQIDLQLERLVVPEARLQLVAPKEARVLYLPSYNEGDTIQAYDTVLVLAYEDELLFRSAFVSDHYLNTAVEVSAQIGTKAYGLIPHPMDWSVYMTLVINDKTPYSYHTIEGLSTTSDVVSGMYAPLKVVTQRAEDVLILPKNTIYREGSTRYVYVVKDNVREKREVEIGLTNDSWIEIESGLVEGEEVYVHD